jgi:hypothetical protein
MYLLCVIIKSVEPTEEQCGAGERGGVPCVLLYILALCNVKICIELAKEQRGAGERGGVPGVVPPGEPGWGAQHRFGQPRLHPEAALHHTGNPLRQISAFYGSSLTIM